MGKLAGKRTILLRDKVCSDDARLVTGHDLRVESGRTAAAIAPPR